MASVVQISNRALQKLGAKSIVSLTEDSVNARAANLCYEDLRRAELRKQGILWCGVMASYVVLIILFWVQMGK